MWIFAKLSVNTTLIHLLTLKAFSLCVWMIQRSVKCIKNKTFLQNNKCIFTRKTGCLEANLIKKKRWIKTFTQTITCDLLNHKTRNYTKNLTTANTRRDKIVRLHDCRTNKSWLHKQEHGGVSEADPVTSCSTNGSIRSTAAGHL